MVSDEKTRHLPIPIPTYEEATSSRPTSSQSYTGAEQTSDDAERQGLLGRQEQGPPRRNGDYQAPTVESARSSIDSDLHLPEVDGERIIEELDYMEAGDELDTSRRSPRLYHRSRIRSKYWGQRLTDLGATLSSIRLPTFRSWYTAIPTNTTSTTTPADPPAPSSPTTESPPAQPFLPRLRPNLNLPTDLRLNAPILARLTGLFIIGTAIYMLFALDLFPGGRNLMAARFDPESVRAFVQDHMKSETIEEYGFHLSSYDHVAGTEGDLFVVRWLEELWGERGHLDQVQLEDYWVYADYPTKEGREVRVIRKGGERQEGFELELEEIRVDPTMDRQQTLVWHGYSGDGEVEGPLVYANGGSREDFEWLKEHDVTLNGTIALVRYHSTELDLGMKIKAAEEAGCAGVLVFSDPSEDGAGKGDVWPQGPWRSPESVQRDSASLMNIIMGDPLTPGHASTEKAKRSDPSNNPALPKIPSLPLPWRSAQKLIEQLKGHGPEVPKSWRGGDSKKPPKRFAGNNEGPIVHLQNHNDRSEKQQIWNLHGRIQGYEQPEKSVVVGSHHDSWCFGAAEAGSGTAVMTHVIEILSKLRAIGWRPLRSIEFVSWDASQYNAVGSTEYVEEHTEKLRDEALAYLNVDVGVYGPDFHASGSPLLRRALHHVLDRVTDPHTNASLKHLWDSSSTPYSNLGAEGDATPWTQIAGTASLDFGFKGPDHAFPKGSCFDTHEWMLKFGDPAFGSHQALAQVWALLILQLADTPLLPLDAEAYAREIKEQYIPDLLNFARGIYESDDGKGDGEREARDKQPMHEAVGFSLDALHAAADRLAANAAVLHRFEDLWTTNVLGRGGLETASYSIQRFRYNDRLAGLETGMLDLPPKDGDGKRKAKKGKEFGAQGREQFKHVLFGPTAKGGRKGVSFPIVRDAIERGEWEEAQRLVERAAEVVELAAAELVDQKQ